MSPQEIVRSAASVLNEDVHEGGSMAWTLRDRQGAGRDDHHITVVSLTMMYYRWAVSEEEDEPES